MTDKKQSIGDLINEAFPNMENEENFVEIRSVEGINGKTITYKADVSEDAPISETIRKICESCPDADEYVNPYVILMFDKDGVPVHSITYADCPEPIDILRLGAEMVTDLKVDISKIDDIFIMSLDDLERIDKNFLESKK